MPDIDVKIQWHSPDQVYAAVFIRDGEPWFLEGALVGMGPTPGDAVTDLVGIAEHLVIEGTNFLTGSAGVSNADRRWLFNLFDVASERSGEMFLALKAADEADTLLDDGL